MTIADLKKMEKELMQNPEQVLDELSMKAMNAVKPMFLKKLRAELDPVLRKRGVETAPIWEELASKTVQELKDMMTDLLDNGKREKVIIQLLKIAASSAKPLILKQLRARVQPIMAQKGIRIPGLWDELAALDVAKLQSFITDITSNPEAVLEQLMQMGATAARPVFVKQLKVVIGPKLRQ
jgi:hypothetical protein